jgi:hypothetical protein
MQQRKNGGRRREEDDRKDEHECRDHCGSEQKLPMVVVCHARLNVRLGRELLE